MNIFDAIWILWENFISALGPAFIGSLIRANLILLVSSILCSILLQQGNRIRLLQYVALWAGLAIGLSIPLKWFRFLDGFFHILVPVLIIGVVLLPNLLAYHLEPRAAYQIKVRNWIWGILGVLFVINFFVIAGV